MSPFYKRGTCLPPHSPYRNISLTYLYSFGGGTQSPDSRSHTPNRRAPSSAWDTGISSEYVAVIFRLIASPWATIPSQAIDPHPRTSRLPVLVQLTIQLNKTRVLSLNWRWKKHEDSRQCWNDPPYIRHNVSLQTVPYRSTVHLPPGHSSQTLRNGHF